MFGKTHQAHRIVWQLHNGQIPDGLQIDHINGIKDDNRIENLRLDVNKENPQNISEPQCNNTSGYLGVSWNEREKKWRAQIMVKGKRKYLGLYDTKEEAYEAYLAAKRDLHPFWVEKK